MANVTVSEATDIAAHTGLSSAFVLSDHYPTSVARQQLMNIQSGAEPGRIPETGMSAMNSVIESGARESGILSTAANYWGVEDYVNKVQSSIGGTFRDAKMIVWAGLIVGGLFAASKVIGALR